MNTTKSISVKEALIGLQLSINVLEIEKEVLGSLITTCETSESIEHIVNQIVRIEGTVRHLNELKLKINLWG